MAVDILTPDDRAKLLLNALADGNDHAPVVKISLRGTPAVWLLSEADPDFENRLFGLCDLGMGEAELGFVDLDEIIAVSLELGLTIERDDTFVTDVPISVYAQRAREAGCIVL